MPREVDTSLMAHKKAVEVLTARHESTGVTADEYQALDAARREVQDQTNEVWDSHAQRWVYSRGFL